MADGDEYSKEDGDVEPNGLMGVHPTIIGRPGADLSENPTVKIRERRWLNRFRKFARTVTRPQRVELGSRRPMKQDGMCWEETLCVDDVVTFDEEQTEEKYEDWEFEVAFDDYLRWVNMQPGIQVTVPPGATIPDDGVLPFGRIGVKDIEGRSFIKPDTERQVDSGWTVIDGKPVSTPRIVERGNPFWLPSEKRPCPDEPAKVDGPPTETAQFRAIDIETGQPIRGSMDFKGLNYAPKAISDETWGYGLLGHQGGQYTIVYQPPAGYEVVGNSEKQTPADTLQLTFDTHIEDIRQFVFFARKVKASAPGGGASQPPVAPAPPESAKPKEEPKEDKMQPATGPDDGLPPPSPPKSLRHRRRIPMLPLFGGFLLLLLIVVILLVALHPFGASTPSSPAANDHTSTPASPSPTGTVTPPIETPSSQQVFAPNTVFDGCLVIDPQGSTTVIGVAFTVSNPQPGDYGAAFSQSPTGLLSGTGTASDGKNPVVVPMRATAFGTYGGLSIETPDGRPVKLGPLAAALPLELNAETDRPTGCTPSALDTPTPRNLAARDYLRTIAPVNTAAATFAARSQTWTGATSNAEAQRDAHPLLMAFQSVHRQLPDIATIYPAAGDDLDAADAAVQRLIQDLSDLAKLDATGVSAWRQGYEADLAKLSEASSRVRQDLGLPPLTG